MIRTGVAGVIEKVDVVMRTKNSSKFLALVLKRIEEVIPSEVVGKKIIIDGHSTDNTVEIATIWDGAFTKIREMALLTPLKPH